MTDSPLSSPPQTPADGPAQDRIAAPWGESQVLARDSNFKIKRIHVKPGHRLSLQRHQHRSEHWYVVSGTADVEVAGSRRMLKVGEAVDIPHFAWHRLANNAEQPLVLVEIQQGSYFGEDDIERAADDYGRAKDAGAPLSTPT